jgi:hypothetical protein
MALADAVASASYLRYDETAIERFIESLRVWTDSCRPDKQPRSSRNRR